MKPKLELILNQSESFIKTPPRGKLRLVIDNTGVMLTKSQSSEPGDLNELEARLAIDLRNFINSIFQKGLQKDPKSGSSPEKVS
jgi:hypothetical protein